MSLTAYAEAETVLEVKKGLTYDEHRKAVQDALEVYRKEPTKEVLMGVIDTYLQLPTLEEYSKIDFVNDKKDFAEDILIEINKITIEIDQLEVKTYFATKSVELIFTSGSFNDWGVANSLIKLLPEGEIRTDLASKLEQAKDVLPKKPNDYIDWNNPPDNLNDYLDKNPIPEYDNLPPGVNKDDYENNTKPIPPLSLYDRSEISYRIEDGKCYKVSDYYKNGKIVKTEKVTPDKTELLFCGTSGDTSSEHNPFPGAGSGIGTSNKPISGVFDGFDPYSNSAMDEIRKEEDKENIKGLITIQYTFEKSSESPYFYDSGITISNDKTVTYTQAKDALHMISIQARGKFVEDKNKAIALIDGKIVRVINSEKPMSFDSFASLFNEMNLSVRALDTRSGEQVEMADLVEIKGVNSIIVKDKEIHLVSKAIVDNSIVLFPIEQIAKELGATITKTDKTISIQNKNNTLIYEDGISTLLSNEKKIDLQVSVRINKDGVMMAPIRAFVDALDLTIELVDSKVVIK
jgi:hypothetical protein